VNADAAITLAALRGKCVLAVAFQMLCPGCVSHGLPQARRVRALFPQSDLMVIGLHTMFEHHEAQGPDALRDFLHARRIAIPVGVDAPAADGGLPQTMRACGMQGTPTTLLIDRKGRLRLHKFGHVEDLRLGAALASLIGEAR
jgi:hypothetical protein